MASNSESILELAAQALRSWEPLWTGFLDGQQREETEQQLALLAELNVQSWGGHPGAERRRLLLQHQESSPFLGEGDGRHGEDGLGGLEISGNFLFDPATAADFRSGLLACAGVDPSALGDVWVRGDRGAQAIVCTELADLLDDQQAQVRSIDVQLQARPLGELQLPAQRMPRRLNSVEASLRLDALASAGFGLSRSRMAGLIRQGDLRLNWQSVSSPSQELKPGDRVQWSGRGELTLEAAERTKRERWRVVMVRC
ncbi:photosystem II S4 domain protein [Cyanobium sp. WAJ14-Wanaka]|uniref:photosystem II S4 domain protein n=1 Tax=Cyanobium sp. WAJ14-Wanaka TaxID=2823725 RepID=UPI0020CD46BF|nr:photosystem II S4 domain protein [Cyanobium sp. WAJ14-Wanaka]MCP9775188.1 photosystem II S4 domain protein [Cyanobium sp. WAJ14-Wanaka]